MEIHLPEDLQRFVRDEVRTGRYTSEQEVVQEAVEHFKQARHVTPSDRPEQIPASMPDRGQGQSTNRKPLWEIIADIARRVPDEEWDRIPNDASYQLDHYLYGSPKKPAP